ncbi:hypothetical protein D3C71_1586120 [compost metagenome]
MCLTTVWMPSAVVVRTSRLKAVKLYWVLLPLRSVWLSTLPKASYSIFAQASPPSSCCTARPLRSKRVRYWRRLYAVPK